MEIRNNQKIEQSYKRKKQERKNIDNHMNQVKSSKNVELSKKILIKMMIQVKISSLKYFLLNF